MQRIATLVLLAALAGCAGVPGLAAPPDWVGNPPGPDAVNTWFTGVGTSRGGDRAEAEQIARADTLYDRLGRGDSMECQSAVWQSVLPGGRDRIVPPQSVRRLAAKLGIQDRKKVLIINRRCGGHATSYRDTMKTLEFVLGTAGAGGNPHPPAAHREEDVHRGCA